MTIKKECDDHGCSVLSCGCDISVLESSSNFHQILVAKDKWINELLNKIEELENLLGVNEL